MRKQLKSLMWLRRRIILSNKSLLIQVLLPFGFTYLYKKLTEIQGALNTESKVRLLKYGDKVPSPSDLFVYGSFPWCRKYN